MVEELGEVLKADKRWKSHRNVDYDSGEKLTELADVFITAMNLCIFSGYSIDVVMAAIESKQRINFKRLQEEK